MSLLPCSHTREKCRRRQRAPPCECCSAWWLELGRSLLGEVLLGQTRGFWPRWPLLDRALPFPPGWILIDRCGKHFGTILNYLRDGAVPLPESRREIEELLAEAKYYLVQGLVDECQAALQVGRTAGACCLMTYKPISPCNSRAAQMVPGEAAPQLERQLGSEQGPEAAARCCVKADHTPSL